MTLHAVSFDDIEAAAVRRQVKVLDTPCVESRTLGQIAGCRIFLKFENLQFTASFKERGALNKLAALIESGAAINGVITASAGNHAQGVAYHSQRLGLHAVIVMPQHTPAVKVGRTRGFGAEVVLHGDSFDEAHDHALALAAESGLAFFNPLMTCWSSPDRAPSASRCCALSRNWTPWSSQWVVAG